MGNPVTLTIDQRDIQNIIAFGNRATMTGAEADTWAELKQRLARIAQEAAQERDEGRERLLEGVPGGTA